MELREIYQVLNHSEPKPEFLETIVIACGLLVYIIYFLYVVRTGNSKIISFSTLLITAGTILILVIRELVNKRRWLIVVQYSLLVGIIAYLGFHRWGIHTSERLAAS
jgi:hypothetical protein